MSTPTPAALLAVADHRARNLITSEDPVTLAEWEAFDDTLYRLLHTLVGPGRRAIPSEAGVGRDILTTFRSYPAPIRPARGESYGLHEAARLQGLPVNRITARVRRGQIDTHTLRTGRRAWIIDADQLDTRTDVTPAHADDPHPLARLTVALGALADLYKPTHDDTRAPDTRPVDDHNTAETMRHVLSIASVTARHTITHLPIADANRPLLIAQYADRVLETLNPTQSPTQGATLAPPIPERPSQGARSHQPPPGHTSAPTPSPAQPEPINDRLGHAIDDWAAGARDALRHQVPSTEVLRNILTTGVHLLATTDACLHQLSTQPTSDQHRAATDRLTRHGLAKLQIDGVRPEIKATALALQEAANAWRLITTAMTPSRPYVAASRDLFAVLDDVLSAAATQPSGDLTLDASHALVTLADAAQSFNARLATIDTLASQLLHSELLFIRARLVPAREEIVHERLTGRLVVTQERDVPNLLRATHQAREHTTHLTRRLETMATTLTATPDSDRQLAAGGWAL